MKTSLLRLTLCGLFILLATGCAVEPTKGKYRYFPTWENYVYGDRKENAVYFWNRTDIGTGRAGFEKAIALMKNIPDESTVHIFPTLVQNRSFIPGVFPLDLFPFSDYMDELWSIEKTKKLNLIFTNVDERGRKLKGLRAQF